MKELRKSIPDDEYDLRMQAARERAQWELGDPSWAGIIVGAFLYPEEDREALDKEQE